MEDLRARAALNAGDLPAAKSWIKRALEHSGGLTTRTSVLQAEIRGDAAIAYRLSGDEESTRLYLASTGAGHMEKTDWIGRYSGDLPICGTDGIEPQDVAVVQFAINDAGGLYGVVPDYTSRPGSIGAAFAQSVGTWRWNPEDLNKVSGYWRSTLRLELRCQTRPTPESLGKRFMIETAQWLKATGHLPADFPIDSPKG